MMEEGHFKLSVIRRSKGHLAVMKAAYRAGEKLYDERVGRTWNYGSKRHVDDCTILAPDGAPAWVFDRQALWNAVERAEKRPDAQLALELEVSLPRELSDGEQLELIHSFVHEHFVARGRIADCAIHRPEGNPHAHVMLTMRPLDPDGGFAKQKERTWNIEPDELKKFLRPAWEHAANRALANAGLSERINMRSYRDRGLALVPQPKLFRAERDAHLDGRDLPLEATIKRSKTRLLNGETLKRHPEQALALVTCSGKKLTFTRADIERVAKNHSSSDTQRAELVEAILASPELIPLGTDARGRERFSTQEVVEQEHRLLSEGHLLAQRGTHSVNDRVVADSIARAPDVLGLRGRLTDEQAAAVRHIALRTGDLAIVEGYAGTGKSTMLGAARLAWEAQGYTVVGAALAGKAAESLREDTRFKSHAADQGLETDTLAGWQWSWHNNRRRLTYRHVLIVDEAGMVGTDQFGEILAEARAAGAKVVIVGDTKQLQAIDPGAPMRLLQTRYGAATLAGVMRQRDHDWQRDATLAFAQGDAKQALTQYCEQGRVHAHTDMEAAQNALVSAWDRARREAPTETSLILAYRRIEVRALNDKARALRAAAGELGSAHTFSTERGEREFASNDRVYFLKNDRELGVKNGTLGTIEEMRGTRFTIRLDSQKRIEVDLRSYDALDHGYAGTVHKSQGATVDRTYLLASRYMDAASSYVALSRHRADANVFYSEEQFPSSDALIKRLARVVTAEMAHEVVDKAAQAAEERRVVADAAFLALPPHDQLAKLEALRLIGEQRPLKPEHFVNVVLEVKEAAKVRDLAAVRVTEAARTRDIIAFGSDRDSAWRQDHELARATEALQAAEQSLATLQTDPATWERARSDAKAHVTRVRAAQVRWQQLRRVQTEAERRKALESYVSSANVQAKKPVFRVATDADIGKLFDPVDSKVRRLGDAEILVMRSREKREFVVAYAEDCGDERGARIVRPRSLRAPTLRPARSRGPDRG